MKGSSLITSLTVMTITVFAAGPSAAQYYSMPSSGQGLGQSQQPVMTGYPSYGQTAFPQINIPFFQPQQQQQQQPTGQQSSNVFLPSILSQQQQPQGQTGRPPYSLPYPGIQIPPISSSIPTVNNLFRPNFGGGPLSPGNQYQTPENQSGVTQSGPGPLPSLEQTLAMLLRPLAGSAQVTQETGSVESDQGTRRRRRHLFYWKK